MKILTKLLKILSICLSFFLIFNCNDDNSITLKEIFDSNNFDSNHIETIKADYLSFLENDVIYEHNLARTDPKKYATFLIPLMDEWESMGKGDVLQEAIDYLLSQSPKGVLTPVYGMCRAAKDHALFLSEIGEIQHEGAGGSTPASRLNLYGTWLVSCGENIAGGYPTGREILIGLIIDDGIPSRGHRLNIFNNIFHKIGVSCQPSPKFNPICVIDYAYDYK